MFIFLRKNRLAAKCRAYLEKGPPSHMANYVPESLTEIIISHGAQKNKLDMELTQMAELILCEENELQTIHDLEIREYMMRGMELVREILRIYRD